MTRLGRSYAHAFLDSAPAGYDVEGFLAKAQDLLRALDQGRFRVFLTAPSVPQSAKQAALEEVGRRLELDEYGRRFFQVLLENRRIAFLGEILSAVREEYDRRRGVVEARVTVPAPVGEGETERIAEAISRRLGKKVRIRLDVDPGVLGGFVARVGSEVFDASAAGAIRRFAANAKEGAGA